MGLWEWGYDDWHTFICGISEKALRKSSSTKAPEPPPEDKPLVFLLVASEDMGWDVWVDPWVLADERLVEEEHDETDSSYMKERSDIKCSHMIFENLNTIRCGYVLQ